MNEPIITEVISQRCVGYRNNPNGDTVSIIQNVGLDADGNRWTWKSEHISRMGDDGFYITIFGNDYQFLRIG